MLRLTLIVLAFGFGQLIAASPQLKKRNVTSTSAAGWEFEMYDFGCEISPKKKDGKCWTMCEDSDAIKNPKWCYTGTHPKSPNPVILFVGKHIIQRGFEERKRSRSHGEAEETFRLGYTTLRRACSHGLMV
ncbi:hypothetical protein ONZ45_g15896 [Pleurotus djamor]|nr:hypothetical protein ONZ45_g15896 [Pleurotus djamor]